MSAIFARDLGADLTERISDLDGKLIGLNLILGRIVKLDEYLEGVQQ
ncbi:MAG: hypothetical protein HKN85_00070 [Gammaproteobacteria bacterium]|nr:hypothetical protein [Gammaproteobacteria bacterium]